MNKNEYLDNLLLRWDKNLNEQRKSSLTSREQAIKKFENLKNRISDKINKTNKVLSKFSINFSEPKIDRFYQITWNTKINKIEIFFSCVVSKKNKYSYEYYDPESYENLKVEYDPENSNDIDKTKLVSKNISEAELTSHNKTFSKHYDKLIDDSNYNYLGEDSFEDILEIFFQEFEIEITNNNLE